MPAKKIVRQIGLRLREDLRLRLLREAQRNGRPLNGELATRLEKSLDADAVRSLEAIVADLGKIRGRLRQSA